VSDLLVLHTLDDRFDLLKETLLVLRSVEASDKSIELTEESSLYIVNECGHDKWNDLQTRSDGRWCCVEFQLCR
jgi:hypothetical protein